MSFTDEVHREVPLAEPVVGERETAAVAAVIEDGMLADGLEVRAFEDEFAAFCDAEHAVGVANGTAALHAALIGLGVGPGDTVVTTPLSFIATANAARLVGADVAFADVDPDTGNVDPYAVDAQLREHDDAAAVVAVHLYGHPADMDALQDVTDAHGVPLVEDAAQAHGARYRGDPVGAIGDVGCFSFYPTKNVTTGEGGMVVTDRDDVRTRVERFVNHGRTADGNFAHVGHNFRMTSLAAAMGRVQLERLPDFLEARREHAAGLTDVLADTAIVAPTVAPEVDHAWHQYTVQHDDRDDLAEALAAVGVQTGVYYPRAIHQEAPYRSDGRDAPIARGLTDRVLSLPVHPALSRDDRQVLHAAIADYAAEH